MPAVHTTPGAAIRVGIHEIPRGQGERVQIARVPSSPARRVGLRPVGGGAFAKRADGRALVRLLEALPVVVGPRVRVAPFGSRIPAFDVV